MYVEDAIALDEYVTQHQRNVIDTAHQLSEDAISTLVSSGNVQQQHAVLARDIVARKYTPGGWRDYMYCLLHTQDDVADHIASYCAGAATDAKSRLELFITLFYAPTLVTVAREVWKYFCRGIWIDVKYVQVRNMILERIAVSHLGETLGCDDKVVSRTLAHIEAGRACTRLYVPMFDEVRDIKDTVFNMPTMAYDIQRNILRIGLPSDMSTLRGTIDADIGAWAAKRQDMMVTLQRWMSDEGVVESYLDMLASAVSEFRPRYALVNSGTGSDGKSTFAHVLKALFGGYCAILPAKGLSSDARNANDATPLLNSLVGKRLSITPDAMDVVAVIASPGFKSISGGDEIYRRGLHQEASAVTPRLKMLAMINTNQTSIVLTQISELTRIKIVRWLSKTVTEEDRAVIPLHRLAGSSVGVFNYEREFLDKYGSCLMAELLGRHDAVRRDGYNVYISPTIRQWTRELVSPRTILNFLESHTEPADNFGAEDVSIETLFTAYAAWRRLGGRFSSTDPTTVDAFACHVEFYHKVSVRRNKAGTEEHYVPGIRLKTEYDRLSIMFPQQRSSNTIAGRMLMENVLRSNRPRDPVIHVQDA